MPPEKKRNQKKKNPKTENYQSLITIATKVDQFLQRWTQDKQVSLVDAINLADEFHEALRKVKNG